MDNMGQTLSYVQESDIADITTLFLTADPRHQRSSVYYKHSNSTPFGEGVQIVAKDGDNIIGHYAIAHLQFSYQGKIYNIGYAQQAIIHPKYRNLKLITQLHNKAMQKADEHFDAVYAFSNDEFIQVKKQLFGWEDMGSFHADVLKLDSLSFTSHYQVKALTSWRKSITIDTNYFTLLKSTKYLNHRLAQHPISHYKNFEVDEKEATGYITLKFYLNENRKLIGHFIDYEASSEKVLSSLLHKAKEYFSFYGVEEVHFWNYGKFQYFFEPYIQSKSFKTNFLVYHFNKENVLPSPQVWSRSMILSDAF